MTRKDEEYLFDLVESLKVEVHENNKMLKSIISVINTYLSRHHQENIKSSCALISLGNGEYIVEIPYADFPVAVIKKVSI